MKLVLLFLVSQFAYGQIKQLPLDFTTRNVQLTEGVMAYGSALFPWGEWIKRPTAGPLRVPSNFDKSDLEIFEARSAGIVKRPVTHFTAAYLHNIETIRKLDPQNKHQVIPGNRFMIETIVPFPKAWADMVAIGKKTNLLDDKTTDHLKVTSVFNFKTKKDIEGSPDLRNSIKLLDITGQFPDAVNLQGTTRVNQIADFISVVTLFYGIGPQRTLVVSHMAVALKRHILRMGVDKGGIKLNGRSILMGENPLLNTDKGIGAGVPKYAAEFLQGTLTGLEK